MSRRSRRKRRRKKKKPTLGHRAPVSIKKTYSQSHGDDKKQKNKKKCREKVNYEE